MTIQAISAESYDGKTERDRLAEGEAILDDKNAGMRVSQLMEKYGLSKATVHRRINQALKDRLALTVDQYRESQNAVLDDLAGRWVEQAAAARRMVEIGLQHEDLDLVDKGMARHAEALNGILRLNERRARLNGLDAPVKVDARVTVTTPTDDALSALTAQMREREHARAAD